MSIISDITKEKINSVIQEFNNLELNDYSKVLLWFYKFNNSSILFENALLSKYIYDKLKINGYSNNIDLIDERNTLLSLIGNVSLSDEEIAHNLIALIMIKLRNHESVGLVLSSLITSYNEIYNSKLVMELMLDNLKNKIGNNVLMSISKDEGYELISGYLEYVDFNSGVVIDGVNYPFESESSSIISISSITGEVLFNNLKIKNDKKMVNMTA